MSGSEGSRGANVKMGSVDTPLAEEGLSTVEPVAGPAEPFDRERVVAQSRRHRGFPNPRVVTWVSLTLILGAAAFLRLWQLDAFGFNSDEAVYAGQAAAIAEDPVLSEFFPIFRAHPLLFQSFLSIVFKIFGVHDIGARVVMVALGLVTVVAVYHLGKLLYGRTVGLVAALFMGLMPYHVIVSRQVLLDVPMTMFAVVTMYLLARFAMTERPIYLYATAASLGLTVLSKEPSILLLGSIYFFLALAPEARVKFKHLILATLSFVLVITPFPLTLWLAGATTSGENYLAWQLFRRPNHEWSFYPATVPGVVGFGVVAVALVGLWLFRDRFGWREKLLLSWIVVPGVFFELWPVKGFQYLLPLAPAVAILGARVVGSFFEGEDSEALPVQLDRPWVRETRWLGPLLVGVLAVSLFIPSFRAVQPVAGDKFLAGSGGVPGGREAGLWMLENVPAGAQVLTIGPSMANIIQYYGNRQSFGLSVSPNPLHRNPSYQPVNNPDLSIRYNDLQYIVWDAFSAARSEFFSAGVLRYVDRYNGRVVHTETITVKTDLGEDAEVPVITIYEVRP